MASEIRIHPAVDNGLAAPGFGGGTLKCHCTTDKVTVAVGSQSAHNHLCGCSKCWRPPGSLFSMVAVVGRDKVRVTANEQKLKVVDPTATIQRYGSPDAACICMAGSRTRSTVLGLDFIHTELSDEQGWSPPAFAAFVSSIIEQGTDPKQMDGIRERLRGMGLHPYRLSQPAADGRDRGARRQVPRLAGRLSREPAPRRSAGPG